MRDCAVVASFDITGAEVEGDNAPKLDKEKKTPVFPVHLFENP